MCILCNSNPCLGSCPNYEDPKPKKPCINCNDGICVGDGYIETPGGLLCRTCFDEMTTYDLLNVLDIPFMTM